MTVSVSAPSAATTLCSEDQRHSGSHSFVVNGAGGAAEVLGLKPQSRIRRSGTAAGIG